jgi:hypothetical protein
MSRRLPSAWPITLVRGLQLLAIKKKDELERCQIQSLIAAVFVDV